MEAGAAGFAASGEVVQNGAVPFSRDFLVEELHDQVQTGDIDTIFDSLRVRRDQK